MTYNEVLAAKLRPPDPDPVPPWGFPFALFDWQELVSQWALRKGRAALFEDCGLGKTIQELAWGVSVVHHTNRSVLLLSPLGAAIQTAAEAEKFDIDAVRIKSGAEMQGPRVYIANYERLNKFDLAAFGGVILDESSILKDFSGVTRRALTEGCRGIRYRLSCTATPAPNDVTELANQAEFLGIMSRAAMLATYFINDQKGEAGSKWRLKKHAQGAFYDWLATWSVYIRSPEDLGYAQGDYALPEHRETVVKVPHDSDLDGVLFKVDARSLKDVRAVRRTSIQERLDVMLRRAVSGNGGPRLTWCSLNDESAALVEAFPEAVEVRGTDDPDAKEEALMAFSRGEIDHLVTKARIAGHGMNWQVCSRQTFFGIDHSYESYYQASRRIYRFGQREIVETTIITSDVTAHIWDLVQRKRDAAQTMSRELAKRMRKAMERELKGSEPVVSPAPSQTASGDGWTFHYGDSVEKIREIDECSVGYQLMSPPFPDVYAYSDSLRDLGNADWPTFWAMIDHLIPEMLRVSMPGRLATFHCMDIPIQKGQEGYVGLRDFPGEIIRRFEAAGWRYFARRMIWKDPVVENARTHSLGHGNLLKDSAKSRAGLPDYLVTFQKPGENPEPIAHDRAEFSVEQWQKWASPSWTDRELTAQERQDIAKPPEWMLAPVWYDIRQSDTLQKESARIEKDEKHICPLQLTVISRCLTMWSNSGDLVATWFGGIGSEGFVAVKMGRRALLVELKESYWRQGVRNMQQAAQFKDQRTLWP